jgi:hypothetical protein
MVKRQVKQLNNWDNFGFKAFLMQSSSGKGSRLTRLFDRMISLRQLSDEEAIDASQMREGINEPAGVAVPDGYSPEPTPGSPDPSAEPPPPVPPGSKSKPKSKRSLHWSLPWLVMLAIFSGMGTAALVWLTTLPPLPDCQQPSHLTVDAERLYCAQEAAKSGELPKLLSGLELVKQWGPDHPLHAEAQRLINEWSVQLLKIARGKAYQNDLKASVEIINHIPKTSPVYKEAQEALAYWRDQWKEGSAIYAKAQEALKQQNWTDASNQLQALSEMQHDFWRYQQAGALAKQIGEEKQARQVLGEAQKLMASGDPGQLSAAIAKAAEVPQGTYAAADTTPYLKTWSQKLLALGVQKWNHGDTAGAVSLLSATTQLPPSPETQDLVRFSNAYKLVIATRDPWVPAMTELWNLQEAIAAMEQVKSDSPFYDQAQSAKQSWKGQLKDLIQLKFASLTASLGQRSMLNLAVQEANQVGADRPRRVQAQTLVAYWRQAAERIEDQPILAQAMALAKSGKIPDLQTAITTASQIRLGRALRGEAQNWIATWRGRIETIEDQPMMDQAWALANQNDLDGAILAASRIQSGRTLYREAQQAIANWQTQQVTNAQLAVDQPILDRATALAEDGDLTSAINMAAQIEPGRALYGQAQGAIARWKNERDAANAPAASPEPSPLDGLEQPFDSFTPPYSAPGGTNSAQPNSPGGLPQIDQTRPDASGIPPSLNLTRPNPAPAPPVSEPAPPNYEPTPPAPVPSISTPPPANVPSESYYNGRPNQRP